MTIQVYQAEINARFQYGSMPIMAAGDETGHLWLELRAGTKTQVDQVISEQLGSPEGIGAAWTNTGVALGDRRSIYEHAEPRGLAWVGRFKFSGNCQNPHR